MSARLYDSREMALKAISDGYHVFPCCWPDDKGNCACGRNHIGRDIGKVPLTEHGLKDSTQTILGVNHFWKRYPLANIGAVVGDSRLVLDADLDKGGNISIDKIQAKYSKLPDTRTHVTGGGGLHLIYTVPAGVKCKSNLSGIDGFSGLDIKARDSYIIYAGSLHRSGNWYEVIDERPPVPAPDFLLRIATGENAQNGARTSKQISKLHEGSRHVDLIAYIGKWRARGFTEDEIRTQAYALNQQCDKPLNHAEVDKMVDQYAAQGMKNSVIRGALI